MGMSQTDRLSALGLTEMPDAPAWLAEMPEPMFDSEPEPEPEPKFKSKSAAQVRASFCGQLFGINRWQQIGL